MQNNNTNSNSTEPIETEFNLKEQLEKYLFQWKWFVLSVLVCLICSYLYLRYVTPEYKTNATILIKDDKKGGISSEMSSFADLGILGGVKSNVDNEIEVLKAKSIVQSVVVALDLNVTYFNVGRLKTSQTYHDCPITVTFLEKVKGFYFESSYFTVKATSPSKFELIDSDGEKLGIYSYGQTIKNKLGSMVITKNTVNANKPNSLSTVSVQLLPIDDVVSNYQSRLQVNPANKATSSVLNISIVDPIKEIGIDFLNTLIRKYNENAITDKNLVSEKTETFINTRLKNITLELDSVETNLETFKKINRLTDLTADAEIFLTTASEYEKFSATNETQLKVVNSMLDYISKSTTKDIIPSNIMSESGDASALVETYNKLVSERSRVSISATDENQTIKTFDNQLNDLRTSIVQSLNSAKKTLQIKKRDLRSQESIISGKIGQVPGQEKAFRGISRKQQIKETLYLYLLQKREENAISLAVTSPNSKIIDQAYAISTPVSPKRNVILLGALILGLLIPFAIIYILDLLDTKVKSRLDIVGKIQVPFIGDVPKSDSHLELINANSRSSSAEAMRIIRTNLDFLVNHVPEGKAKTIFCTSTFPKEGKTFISVNLAGTFALSGKKVLLIGLDIRNPKLEEYMDLPNRGVTTYLSKPNAVLDDLLIKQEGYNHFYVLPAGLVPPNPAELLMGIKVEQMFDILKSQFDYIIVDTAPVSLVADTLLISKFADTFIYVVRANFLDKRMLKLPETLYNEKKLPNMSILLNDTDVTKGYGYGYGYGYAAEEEKSPWYKKFIDSFSFKKKS